MRPVPAARDRGRVLQAALELGANATTQEMGEFAALFQAAWVVRVHGRLTYRRYSPDDPNSYVSAGVLGVERLRAELYDRQAETSLAVFSLPSDPRRTHLDLRRLDTVHERVVDDEARLGAEAQRYAQELGRVLGANVARRLLQRLLGPSAPGEGAPCAACGAPLAATERCDACGCLREGGAR
ncbi:MAG: hypothetical protein AB7N76_03110 [Planctomycetota bacterium]